MYKHQFLRRLVLLCSISLTFSSCNSWLDITPSDSITEKKLFSTKDGFYQALNGIYLDLNKEALYGGTLLCTDIEILAQNYSIPNNNEDYTDLVQYKYKTAYPKSTFQATWNTAYNLILSANKFLTNTEEKKEMLGEDYHLLRGEILGLRAMLHFDLLRLFGPVLKLNPQNKAIPYNKQSELITQTLLPANEIVSLILADLVEAENALAQDPILKEGPLFSSATNNDNQNRFRTLRMNYYAVKALQARVYLYSLPLDDSYRQQAFNAATKVIHENDEKAWFIFVDRTQIFGINPDRIFSSEILFMNQNIRRDRIHKTYFDASVNSDNILAPNEEILQALFSENDYRYSPIWLTSAEKGFPCFYKYASVDRSQANDMIPMIRLSEMYLIAAETAKTSEEGIDYLNILLSNRGVTTLSPSDDLSGAILKEYRKEFFGEGQLFYFYKRKNVDYIPQLSDMPWEAIYITSDSYVVPLPESETMYR